MRKLRCRKNKWLTRGHTADIKMAEPGQKSKSSALFHTKPWPSTANIKLLISEMFLKF